MAFPFSDENAKKKRKAEKPHFPPEKTASAKRIADSTLQNELEKSGALYPSSFQGH